MSRSETIEGASQQVAQIAPDKQVDDVRSELERLMEDAVVLEDTDSLIGVSQEMNTYLIFLQWKEPKLLALITEARARYNEMQEIVRNEEDREAIRLNNAGTPMGRAEKLARLGMAEMRKKLNEMQETRNRYEDEYADLKGFRAVVESCHMTMRQKIKLLTSEYKGTPHQVER
jgi:hypothetical protein